MDPTSYQVSSIKSVNYRAGPTGRQIENAVVEKMFEMKLIESVQK